MIHWESVISKFRRSPIFDKSIFMRAIILGFILLIAQIAFAQNGRTHDAPVYQFAGIKITDGVPTTTCAQILSSPMFIDANAKPGTSTVCVVKSFTVTFMPNGHDLIGPYPTHGSKLTAEELAILQKLKGTSGKIKFDAITATDYDGFPRACSSFVVNYSN